MIVLVKLTWTKEQVDLVMVIPTSVAPADATMDPNNETLYEADLNNQVNTTFNSMWNIKDKNSDEVSAIKKELIDLSLKVEQIEKNSD